MSAERDAAALDQLAAILRRPTWPSGADFLDWCAEIVAATGRDLQNGPTDEYDEDGDRVEGGVYIEPTPAERLEYLRGELRAERMSYGELVELQSLAPHIDLGDTELLEAAGVPEGEVAS